MSPNFLWWRFHYDFAVGCRTVHERSTGCWKLNSSERPRNPEMWSDKHTETWVRVPAIATSRRRGTPRALQSASSYCQSNEHCEVASGVKSPLYLLQQEMPTLPRVRPQDTTPAQPGLSPRELGAGRSPPLCRSDSWNSI